MEQMCRPPTNFKLIAVEKDGVVRIASQGSLTAFDTRPMGINPLQALLGERWASNRILLNLDATPSMDSAATGWLIESTRQCRRPVAMRCWCIRYRTRCGGHWSCCNSTRSLLALVPGESEARDAMRGAA